MTKNTDLEELSPDRPRDLEDDDYDSYTGQPTDFCKNLVLFFTSCLWVPLLLVFQIAIWPVCTIFAAIFMSCCVSGQTASFKTISFIVSIVGSPIIFLSALVYGIVSQIPKNIRSYYESETFCEGFSSLILGNSISDLFLSAHCLKLLYLVGYIEKKRTES